MIDYKKLWERIPVGKNNAVKLEELTELLGCGSTRQARKDIEEMIYNDLIVCNLRAGYFRPGNLKELKAYHKIISSYKKKLLKKEYRLKKAIDEETYVICW